MPSPFTQQQIDGYVKIRGRVVGHRIGQAIVVGLIFTILKTFGALTWSWWWILAPWWGIPIYFILAAFGVAITGYTLYRKS